MCALYVHVYVRLPDGMAEAAVVCVYICMCALLFSVSIKIIIVVLSIPGGRVE